MKAKNQPPTTSETDAKEKLIIYVYEYLTHAGAKRAADDFLQTIHYEKEIQVNQLEQPGFLVNWWCVFWDLYCAAPGKKNLPEPSSEARAFHEFNMRQTVMSPSCAQTSPPQSCPPPFMGAGGGPSPGGPGMMGARYGPPPPMQHQMRPGGPQASMVMGGPRMQTMSPMGGLGGPPPPHPHAQMGGPPVHSSHQSPMMGSPRYTPHPGHMTPGSSGSTPMGPEPGPSPGPLSHRMTPNHSGSPHPQSVGPPNGMGGGSGGPTGLPPQQQRAGPPPPPQQQGAWQGGFGVANSPADQQCFMQGPPQPPPSQQPSQLNSGPPVPGGSVAGGSVGGGTNTVGSASDFGPMMINDGGGMMELKPGANNGGPGGPPNQPQQDEYVMPGYGQQSDHHNSSEAGSEILKLKESLESNDSDQNGFNLDYC